MKPKEVAAAVLQAIDRYRPPLTGQSLLGRPWSLERIEQEIGKLRQSLLLPSVRPMSNQPHEVWLVAQRDGYVVFFDEKGAEYGLGTLEEDGRIEDINVRGDLVGCFMSR